MVVSPSLFGRRVAEKVRVVKKVKAMSKEERRQLMEGMVLGLLQRRRAGVWRRNRGWMKG